MKTHHQGIQNKHDKLNTIQLSEVMQSKVGDNNLIGNEKSYFFIGAGFFQ